MVLVTGEPSRRRDAAIETTAACSDSINLPKRGLNWSGKNWAITHVFLWVDAAARDSYKSFGQPLEKPRTLHIIEMLRLLSWAIMARLFLNQSLPSMLSLPGPTEGFQRKVAAECQQHEQQPPRTFQPPSFVLSCRFRGVGALMSIVWALSFGVSSFRLS